MHFSDRATCRVQRLRFAEVHAWFYRVVSSAPSPPPPGFPYGVISAVYRRRPSNRTSRALLFKCQQVGTRARRLAGSFGGEFRVRRRQVNSQSQYVHVFPQRLTRPATRGIYKRCRLDANEANPDMISKSIRRKPCHRKEDATFMLTTTTLQR